MTATTSESYIKFTLKICNVRETIMPDIIIFGIRIDFSVITPPRFGISLGASEETYALSRFGDAFTEEYVYHSLTTGDYSYYKHPKYLANVWPLRRCAHMTSHIVSMVYNLQGPLSSSSTACASSTHAIGKALRLIEHGDADIVIAGGTDSCLSEFSVAGFYLLGALSENNDQPQKASRPFDLKRRAWCISKRV